MKNELCREPTTEVQCVCKEFDLIVLSASRMVMAPKRRHGIRNPLAIKQRRNPFVVFAPVAWIFNANSTQNSNLLTARTARRRVRPARNQDYATVTLTQSKGQMEIARYIYLQVLHFNHEFHVNYKHRIHSSSKSIYVKKVYIVMLSSSVYFCVIK